VGGIIPTGGRAHSYRPVALVLLGLVRRTLVRPGLRERYGSTALPLAFAVALLWTLHPLQTESVTYTVQRTESLMGLFYLLTLYCFARSVESPRPGLWRGFSMVACLFGMASKEVMVTAPLMVLLYDRTFISGSFAQAWRRHRNFYWGLAGTWLLLAVLMLGAGNRGQSTGFGAGVTWWSYAQTQLFAIAQYLQLSLWPHPLTLDYGRGLVSQTSEILPGAVILALLAAGTAWALWRKPMLGFLGAWFLVILAPSSSVVPVITQTMAEHRMYLPLAAVVVLLGLGLQASFGKRALWAAAILALAWGALTFTRNQDYRTTTVIWSEGIQMDPTAAQRHVRLASDLGQAGRLEECLQEYENALRLDPNNADTENTLGAFLAFMQRHEGAVAHYQKSISLNPKVAEVHQNLGEALRALGRTDEAQKEHAEALRLKPDYADAHYSLGTLLLLKGNTADAIREYDTALRLQPNFADAEYNLGNAEAMAGQWEDALVHYKIAIQQRPNYAVANYGAGNMLTQLGRLQDARAQYETAVRLKPDFAEAHSDLGHCLLLLGRPADALQEFQTALQIAPNFAKAHAGLDEARQKVAQPAATSSP